MAALTRRDSGFGTHCAPISLLGRPLLDKGKPAVRRGRKATGQAAILTAGLPRRAVLIASKGSREKKRPLMLGFTHALGPAVPRICRKATKCSIAWKGVFEKIALAAALVFSYSVAPAQSLSAPSTLHATTYSKSQINLV